MGLSINNLRGASFEEFVDERRWLGFSLAILRVGFVEEDDEEEEEEEEDDFSFVVDSGSRCTLFDSVLRLATGRGFLMLRRTRPKK